MSPVKIVGTSALSASGIHQNEIFESCLSGRSAVNENGLAPISADYWQKLKAEKVPEFFHKSHCTVASHYTIAEAIKNTGWTSNDLQDCGFIFATTTSQIDQWQNSLPRCYMKNLSDAEIIYSAQFQSLGLTLSELREEFKICGPNTVVASSCSASLQALNLATLWIQSGMVKKCLVASTEILSELTVNGFNSMRLLTKGVCKPFDQNRMGINLGEASAVICLEAQDHSERPALAYVRGVGFSSDSYHATAPQPEGTGSYQSMQMALTSAGIVAQDLDWVYAHGTGSPANDNAETTAIKRLYQSSAENISTQNICPISSTKSIHGHTLGACGALETVLAVMCLQHDVLLPTFNTDKIDEKINADIVLQRREKKLNYILKNSLGFGGINSSVILQNSNVLQSTRIRQ